MGKRVPMGVIHSRGEATKAMAYERRGGPGAPALRHLNVARAESSDLGHLWEAAVKPEKHLE